MLKNYNVILLPGDGIGPEVINEAVKVLNTVVKNLILRSLLLNN